MNYSPISQAVLQEIEDEFCTPSIRKAAWIGAECGKAAQGKILAKIRDKRTEKSKTMGIRRVTNVAICARLRYTNGVEISPADLGAFLNGTQVGKKPWEKYSSEMMGFILLGGRTQRSDDDGDAPEDQPVKIDAKQEAIARRIIDYFFGEQSMIFNEKYRYCHYEVTPHEAIKQMDALRRRHSSFTNSDSEVKSRIIRVSNGKRFLQMNDYGGSTASCKPTIQCLKDGVEVFYVFPKAQEPTEAQTSAEKFREFVADSNEIDKSSLARLKLIAIEEDSVIANGVIRFSTEYFNPRWRIVFHYSEVNSEPGYMNLMLSRGTNYPPSTFEADDEECTDFFNWTKLFVDRES